MLDPKMYTPTRILIQKFRGIIIRKIIKLFDYKNQYAFKKSEVCYHDVMLISTIHQDYH